MAEPSEAAGPGAVAVEGASPSPVTGADWDWDFLDLEDFEVEDFEEEEEVVDFLDFLGVGVSHAQKGMNESTYHSAR
jgi:hypothetical protein